jgi:ferric-dicitrate binding protein FerR (iron transport regulator)
MDEKIFYRQLVERYRQNKATDEELELFFHLLKEGKLDDYLLKEMAADSGNESSFKDRKPALLRVISGRWRLAAACVLILLSAFVYLLIEHDNERQKKESVKASAGRFKNDALPGGDKAILTLADGTKISLDSAQNGVLTRQGGTKVIKIGGQLAYQTASGYKPQAAGELAFNTISTPRGGQYQVVLPDGTKVWLNAISSLRFPTTFSENERSVQLNGEAYFEVAPQHLKGRPGKVPFKVNVNGMQVEVLGTHFNVMAYPDEPVMKTTLLEGSVKVTDGGSVMLKPGQQSSVAVTGSGDPSGIQVRDVDVEEAVAWKNGFFQFNKASVADVMRQAARWYDMEVVYEGKVQHESFSGTMPRMQHLSQLLKALELTKAVKFGIEGNKIIVKSY